MKTLQCQDITANTNDLTSRVHDYCDIISKSAMNLSHNSEHHARSKYINIRYHFIKNCVEQKLINLEYISTKNQLVNVLTKTLLINVFNNFTNRINIKENI